jgi:hypothetical protein
MEIPEHIKKAMRTASTEFSEKDVDFPRAKVGGPGDDRIVIIYGDQEFKVDEIEAMLIGHSVQRDLFVGDYDPDNAGSSERVCWSADGIRPSNEVPEPPCDTCARCPKNQWSEGKGGKSHKECRERKAVLLLRPGKALPLVFTLSPTMLRSWKSFVTGAMENTGAPANLSLWKFSVKDDKGKKRLITEHVRFLTENEVKMRQEVREQFYSAALAAEAEGTTTTQPKEATRSNTQEETPYEEDPFA